MATTLEKWRGEKSNVFVGVRPRDQPSHNIIIYTNKENEEKKLDREKSGEETNGKKWWGGGGKKKMTGKVNKMDVGYFAQHNNPALTPFLQGF